MSPGSCSDVADASPTTTHVDSTTLVANIAPEVRASDRERATFASNLSAAEPLIGPSASSPFSGPAGRAAARAHPAPAQTDGPAGRPPQEPPAAGHPAMQPSLAAFTCFSLCTGLSAHLGHTGRQLQRAAGLSQRLVFVSVHLQCPSLLATVASFRWITLAAG